MGTIMVVSDYANIVSARPEAELFISLHHRGWNIVLMVPDTSPWLSRFQEEGITVEAYAIKGRRHPEEIEHMRRILMHHHVDLMLLFNNRAVVNGIRAAAKLQVKVVVYRGSVGNVHWYDPTSYTKVLHPRVDGILCLHNAVKAHLDKQMIFRTIKTEVMRKGHNPKWYQSVEPLNLAEINVPKSAFVVVFVGNVRRVKGLPYLLDATHELAANPNAHLLLVGMGMDTPMCNKAIKASPMSNRIHRLGFRPDALRVVASSQVLVLPSLRSEALTKAVQESMHLGVCPVITDIPGNAGLVEDKRSGRVVPIKDARALGKALLECSDAPEKTANMGKEARIHIRNWLSQQQTIEMAENAFQSFLCSEKVH